MASKVVSTLKETASEPILTGALLYLLTRGPSNLRERILGPFQTNLLAKNGVARLAVFITALKVLTGLGVVRRINGALNSLAWNNWKLFGRPGAPFEFGPEKKELVIITGGSSGFGYEMVKSFANHARVVVLDVADFPPELSSIPDVHFYKCDITDASGVEGLCKEVLQTHGDATVLINNAGIGSGKLVLEVSIRPKRSLRITDDTFRRQMQRAKSSSRSIFFRTLPSFVNSYLGCCARTRAILSRLHPWHLSLQRLDCWTTVFPRLAHFMSVKVYVRSVCRDTPVEKAYVLRPSIRHGIKQVSSKATKQLLPNLVLFLTHRPM